MKILFLLVFLFSKISYSNEYDFSGFLLDEKSKKTNSIKVDGFLNKAKQEQNEIDNIVSERENAIRDKRISDSSRSHSGVDYVSHGDGAFSDMWTVGCNDRSYGTVSLTGSSICSGGAERLAKCVSKDMWTVGSAAEYICR